MRNSDLHTRELDDDSREYPAQPSKPTVDTNDVPLNYHFNGAAWSNLNLRAPTAVQHISIVTNGSAWGFASAEPPPQSGNPFGYIASIYSNAGGQWQALSVLYMDLQSIEVVSSSGASV